MQSNHIKENPGKLVLVASSLLLWLLILVLFKTYGYEKTWQLWKVPTEMPPFLDFRLIPGSAESFLRGYEPTLENPFDPRGRIFNYPMFWRLFFYSGVTQDDTIWIVILMIVLYFIGVFLFPQNLSVSGAIGMLLIAFSPASMLLYERGNVDLIVFFLCAAIVLASERSAYITTLMLMAGTVIKLFPFFGVSLLLRETKTKFIWLSVACFGLLLLYILLTWDSIHAAWNLTLRGDQISYGANVLFYRYEYRFAPFLAQWFREPQVRQLLKFGPMALASLLAVIAGISGWRGPQPAFIASDRNLAAFRMGASIYVGTFLLGNNWDYRLAFLIMVIPQLMEWIRFSSRKSRYIALLSLFAILASCWHFVFWYSPSIYVSESGREGWFMIDELLNWILVPSLTYLLFASFPGWAKESVAGHFQAREIPQDAVKPGFET